MAGVQLLLIPSECGMSTNIPTRRLGSCSRVTDDRLAADAYMP